MRTWEDFKKDAKELNNTTKEDIEEMEVLANIISSIEYSEVLEPSIFSF